MIKHLMEIRTECSICFELLSKDTEILLCNHVFHTNCIESWKRQAYPTCPLCRYPLYDIEAQKPREITTEESILSNFIFIASTILFGLVAIDFD